MYGELNIYSYLFIYPFIQRLHFQVLVPVRSGMCNQTSTVRRCFVIDGRCWRSWTAFNISQKREIINVFFIFFIMIGLPWLPHIVWFLVYIMIQLYIYFGCLVDLFRSWYFHGLYPIGKLKGLPYWYCRDCRSKNIIAKIRRTKMWLLLLQIIYIYI